ncbi:Sulfite exporter TauE/SafE family protein [Entamoeba marina]
MVNSSFEFNWQLIVGSICSMFFATLCSGSGIGGGCFYLVIFVLILQMDPHEAIPLSKITTLGVAVGGFLVLWRKRHPNIHFKPLISYPTALMVEPLTIYGTMLGVLLNITSPSWLIIIVLVLLLGFSSYKTFTKAWKQFKNENEKRAIEREQLDSQQFAQLDTSPNFNDSITSINADVNESENVGDLDMLDNENNSPIQNQGGSIIVDENVQGNGPILLPQDDTVPSNKDVNEVEEKKLFIREIFKAILSIALLSVVWIIMFSIVIFKGGDKLDSIVGVDCGSIWYWVLTTIGFPFTLCVTIAIGAFFKSRQTDEVIEGEIVWSLKNCLLIPTGALFAGVSAAYLGIGGGMVIGPLLLEIGMLPQVTTATSSFMINFTASSSSLQYIIDGKLDLFYGLWYFGVGLIGAVIGQFGFSKLVKKFNRQSFIGFFLGGLIILSTMAMLCISIWELIEDIKDDNLWFQPLCPNDNSSHSEEL